MPRFCPWMRTCLGQSRVLSGHLGEISATAPVARAAIDRSEGLPATTVFYYCYADHLERREEERHLS